MDNDVNDTDGLVEWLTGVLDEIERVARASVEGRAETSWPWRTNPGQGDLWVESPDPGGERGYFLAGPISRMSEDSHPAAMEHAALHDPRAVLARVAAERALLDEYKRSVALAAALHPHVLDTMTGAIVVLAYGHRYDAPGYDMAWAPEGVEVET